MKVLFAGTPSVGIPVLEAVRAAHEVVGVITRPDARAGRGKKLTPSEIAVHAERVGLPVYKPASTAEVDQIVDELAPEVAVVVAYGMLLRTSTLEKVPHGWINLHFSLLPRWRGAAPVQYALWKGDTETGVTTFRIVKELDAGPIYRQIRTPINPEETSGDLLDRLADLGAPVMAATLDDIAAGVQPIDQDGDPGEYAGRITPDQMVIDWQATAQAIDGQVRAANPSPGAWTTLGGERMKILRVRPIASEAAPGEVRMEAKNAVVGTGSGGLELVMVQPPGKKAMGGTDWLRGLRLAAGESVTFDV